MRFIKKMFRPRTALYLYLVTLLLIAATSARYAAEYSRSSESKTAKAIHVTLQKDEINGGAWSNSAGNADITVKGESGQTRTYTFIVTNIGEVSVQVQPKLDLNNGVPNAAPTFSPVGWVIVSRGDSRTITVTVPAWQPPLPPPQNGFDPRTGGDNTVRIYFEYEQVD